MLKEIHEQNKKLIFGLIHLFPMPGSPYYKEGDFERSVEKAIRDTKALENGGASGCLIQTVDKIYPTGDDTDYVELYHLVTCSLQTGGADYTRCTALVGSTTTPFGVMSADDALVGNCFEAGEWGSGI